MLQNSMSVIEINPKEADAVTLLNFVDKYVTVYLIKKLTYNGFIQAIDPLTGT